MPLAEYILFGHEQAEASALVLPVKQEEAGPCPNKMLALYI
jgi:hypothetical protein